MEQKLITFKSPSLILAGYGALARMGEEARNLEARKTLLVTDKGIVNTGIAATVTEVLEAHGSSVEVFDEVTPDPDIACCEACIARAQNGGYELIVGVGGGSSMDIASLTGLMLVNPGRVSDYFGLNLVKSPGVPTFLVATTAGTGAEVTPNAILTDTAAKLKKGVVSPYILPRAAIVDPGLTISMPPRVTSFTGMDALTHAIEAYTSMNASPLTDIHAREAIRLIARSLRTAVAKGERRDARWDMSIGSLYAGIALANAGVGAVHALAYPLGGEFNVPHGIANGLLLPHVMEFNLPGAPCKFADIALLMGEPVDGLTLMQQARRAVDAVHALIADLDMPRTLGELDIPREAVPHMAEAAMNVTRLMNNNPRDMRVADAEAVFNSAF